MKLFKKILSRQESDQQELASHSGESEAKEVKPLISEEEEQATRARMEEELAAQRRERGE